MPLRIFMDGILYITGFYDKGSGQHQVYGSVVAEMGVVGNGTLDVYYNWRLKDGMPVSIINKVRLARWQIDNVG